MDLKLLAVLLDYLWQRDLLHVNDFLGLLTEVDDCYYLFLRVVDQVYSMLSCFFLGVKFHLLFSLFLDSLLKLQLGKLNLLLDLLNFMDQCLV